MHTSIEHGGRGIDMSPPPPPEAIEEQKAAPENVPEAAPDRISSWAKGQVDRFARSARRPDGEVDLIDFIKLLNVEAEGLEIEAAKATKREDKERREAIAALEKNRGGAAAGHAEQAKAWAEKAIELKNKAEALLKIRDAEDKALDALIHGSDKPEDDTATDIRRAA